MASPSQTAKLEECRIVLIGKTGHGKSSTGNTILSSMGLDPSRYFKAGRSMKSTTEECHMQAGVCFDVKVEVVDTPGFFDTRKDTAIVIKEVSKAIAMVSPGLHAILVVLRRDMKFTKEEADCVQLMRDNFGSDIMGRVIIVFTHCDMIDKEDEPDEFLRDCPEDLRSIIHECGNRYIFLDNTEKEQAKKDDKVQQLLSMMIQFDQPFCNPLFEQLEEIIKWNMEHLEQQFTITTDEYIRDLFRAGLESEDRLAGILQEIFDTHEAEQKKSEAVLTVTKKALSDLENKLSMELLEKEKMEVEKAQLAEDYAQLEEKAAQLEKKAKQLQEKADMLEAKTVQLEEKKAQLEQKRVHLEKQLQTKMEQGKSQATENLAQLGQEAEEVDEELAHVKEEKQNLLKEKGTLERERDELKRKKGWRRGSKTGLKKETETRSRQCAVM